jgi:hypothetical protein
MKKYLLALLTLVLALHALPALAEDGTWVCYGREGQIASRITVATARYCGNPSADTRPWYPT